MVLPLGKDFAGFYTVTHTLTIKLRNPTNVYLPKRNKNMLMLNTLLGIFKNNLSLPFNIK